MESVQEKEQQQHNMDKDRTLMDREQQTNNKRAISYVRDGDLSGAAAALTSEGMAPLTDNIKQQMQDKHPEQEVPEYMQQDWEDCMPMQIDIDTVWRILKKLKYNSGSGPSLLRPRHIKACASCKVGFSFAEAFTKAGNKILDGSVDLIR